MYKIKKKNVLSVYSTSKFLYVYNNNINAGISNLLFGDFLFYEQFFKKCNISICIFYIFFTNAIAKFLLLYTRKFISKLS